MVNLMGIRTVFGGRVHVTLTVVRILITSIQSTSCEFECIVHTFKLPRINVVCILPILMLHWRECGDNVLVDDSVMTKTPKLDKKTIRITIQKL